MGQTEDGVHTVEGFALECLYLALALHDEADGHALHTSGREGWLHLTPQHGRELEAYEAVEHAACLLSVDKVHVDMPGRGNGGQDGGFRYLVEDDAVGLLFVEAENLTQMPRDGFSLAVFITGEPDLLRLLHLALQLADHLALVVGHFIVGFHRVDVDTQLFLLQVADVAVARHHLIVLAQEALDGLCLGRTLYDYQILLHLVVFISFCYFIAGAMDCNSQMLV